MELDLNLNDLAEAKPKEDFTLATATILEPPSAEVELAKTRTELAPVTNALQAKARAEVDKLLAIDTSSPAFNRTASALANLGSNEMEKASTASNRLLDRRVETSGASGKVGNDLVSLRSVVSRLDPSRADLTGLRKIFKFLPGGDKMTDYLTKFESSREQLDAIARSLDSGKSEILRDAATLEVEQENLYKFAQNLAQYMGLAEAFDAELVARIDQAKTEGRLEDAKSIERNALFAVRQRHQDIATQIVVARNASLAYGQMIENNRELAKGVDRAKQTTMVMLTVAVTLDQALKEQERVNSQLEAVKNQTERLLVSTSERLQTEGVKIYEQAASTAIDINTLKAAFTNTLHAIEAVDEYRERSTQVMAQQITQIKDFASESSQAIESQRLRASGEATKALY